jgi:transcriptional regulator with XRE-family HTH domain
MSELLDKLRPEFQDKEYRTAYAGACLNAMIAAQIKTLREQREMTQKQLADATGMGQPRIPLLEDASYENWTVNTLKRLARAFDVALSVKFETFSQFICDFERMSRERLQRVAFPNDVQFHSSAFSKRHRWQRRGRRRSRARNWSTAQIGQPQDVSAGITRKPPTFANGTEQSEQGVNEFGMEEFAAAAGA